MNNIFQLNCIHNEELRARCKELIEEIPTKDTRKLEQDFDWYLQLKERESFGSDLFNCYKIYITAIAEEIKRRKNI